MSSPVFEELRDVIQENPRSLRAEQLLDEVLWDALDMATGVRERSEALAHESAAGILSKRILSQAEQSPSTWRIWYAGQLQAVAGVLRAALGRQISFEAEAMIRSRKNTRRILETLLNGARSLSDLAEAVGLDESQLGRDIKILARQNLVETVKEGRMRWVQITISGKTALEKIASEISREYPPVSVRKLNVTWQLASSALSVSSIGIQPEAMEHLASAANMFEPTAG